MPSNIFKEGFKRENRERSTIDQKLKVSVFESIFQTLLASQTIFHGQRVKIYPKRSKGFKYAKWFQKM